MPVNVLTPNIVVTVDRGVSGVGIDTITVDEIDSIYYLNVLYTNGTTELVEVPPLTEASISADEAEASATSAALSATNSATSATSSATSASNAATSASNALASQQAALASEIAADNSADSATLSASSASTSASSATASASAASTSASSASTSATTATTQAGIATTQATTATTQAGIATSQAVISTTQAGISTTKASEALASANSAASSYDQFDDRYLGSKTVAPTVDNDGQPLLTGALYYNSVTNNMNVWTGTVWNAAYISAAGYAPLANPPFTGVVTENGYPIVVQSDIGTAPNEVPLNQYLGDLAYQSSESAIIESGRIDLKGGGSNLLVRSEEFDNASWAKTNSTVTANSTVAPNGTLTADTLKTTAATSVFIISQNLTLGVNTTSIYAKNGTANFFQLTYNGDTTSFANFDLSTGVVGTSGGTVTHSIVDVGGGWYRLVVINTSTAVTGIAWGIVGSASATRRQTFTAAGTETVILWGAQLERSSTLGNYIATEATAITFENASGATALSVIPTTGFDTTYPLAFELASNTSLIVKVKGSDGTVRSATLTLA